MEYLEKLKYYKTERKQESLDSLVVKISSLAKDKGCDEVYKLCYSCLDLTSLGVADSVGSITSFAEKVVQFPLHFSGIPNVASVCVYPSFVEAVGITIGASNIAITSVAGGFPSSQTFLEVKMLEVAMAVESGADEIDIVINVGQMLSGEYEQMASEIEIIADEVGDEVVLKVIVESGELKDLELIRTASLLAMFAGADFVKTSTGKTLVSATPEAAIVMCQAIKDYYEKTGKRIGFKVAGGVRTVEEALLYYTIVEEILGSEWLSSTYFRIGASTLADNLLSAITKKEIQYFG